MKVVHRLRSVEQLVSTAGTDSRFTAAIITPQRHEKVLRQMGFSWPLVLGEAVLPPGHCGSSCSKNMNGWEQKHRDRGMELFHFDQKWNWKMRRGYGFQYASRMIARERKRYPRTLHPPPSMELQILKRSDGSIAVAFPAVDGVNGNKEHLLIAINALVEIFDYAFVVNEALAPIQPIRVAHWHQLTPKNRNWAAILKLVQPAIKRMSTSAWEAARYRFETICSLSPRFCAIGQQGFAGYILWGLPDRGLYLLDTIWNGRATCAFPGMWEAASQLSISELLDETKFTFFVHHGPEWRNELLTKLGS